jgi:AcrR family transcriptional regulator
METAQTTRKLREKQQRRQDIIAAACEVFASRGFTDATLEEIAEKAEFGKGTIYNYFENKEALLSAVIVESLAEVREMLEQVGGDPSRTFRETYLLLAEQLLTYLHDRSGLVLLLMREMHKPEVNRQHVPGIRDIALVLQQPLERAVRSGEIRATDIESALYVFFMTVFGLFQRALHASVSGVEPCCEGGQGRDRHRSGHRDPQAQGHAPMSPERWQETKRRILQVLDDTFFHGILGDEARAATSTSPPPTTAIA